MGEFIVGIGCGISLAAFISTMWIWFGPMPSKPQNPFRTPKSETEYLSIIGGVLEGTVHHCRWLMDIIDNRLSYLMDEDAPDDSGAMQKVSRPPESDNPEEHHG